MHDMVRTCHFTIFVLIIKPGANQYTHLNKTRKHIEEDNENTDHLNSYIFNSRLKF